MTEKCSPLARFSCRCIWFPLPVQLPPPRQPEYPQLQTYIPHLEFSRQRPGEKRHLEHRLRHLPHLLPPFWNLRYNTCQTAYTDWVSIRKWEKKIRNAGIGTAKQSVLLRIHIRANSQTKGLERDWKRRARLFSCFSLASPGLACSWLRDCRARWIENGGKTGENFSCAFYFRVFPISQCLEQAIRLDYQLLDYSSPLSSLEGLRERSV